VFVYSLSVVFTFCPTGFSGTWWPFSKPNAGTVCHPVSFCYSPTEWDLWPAECPHALLGEPVVPSGAVAPAAPPVIPPETPPRAPDRRSEPGGTGEATLPGMRRIAGRAQPSGPSRP